MKSNYQVGIYIRLSKEDMDKIKNQESESVKNQRKLIYKYLKDNKFENYKEYIDDGYSGTNFNRPGFIELMKDIESKQINMVITKDLSRLGRDYIKTGYYVEDYFPSKNIRYISILDGIDTFKNDTNNDVAPFKALFNDMVSKDTSKKIKSILKNKKEQGLFLGSKAPYGYKKDVKNKHKLIIVEEESKAVKSIFKMALEGKSNLSIAKILNSCGISSPKKGIWTATSIYNILKNREYTGCTVSNVWTTISYKNKKRIKKEPHEWIIREGTHEEIIDKKMFEMVNNKKKNKYKKISKKRNKMLLEGLIYCEECGSKMGISYLKSRNTYILNCNKYKKDSSKCSSHYIKYKTVEDYLLISISKEKIFQLINKITIDYDRNIKVYYR